MSVPTILLVSGTRPDTIKLAPVYLGLRNAPAVDVRWIVTGQHLEMLEQALQAFAVVPDRNLEAQTGTRSLTEVTVRVLDGIGKAIDELGPRMVVVQGDTSTTVAGALAGHYAGIFVAHVEAGLRSNRLDAPYPEEANRRITAILTSLHLSPTPRARANLLAEGVPDTHIVVTGNTVVDALELLRPKLARPPWLRACDGLVVVTVHRREAWDAGVASVCRAVAGVARERPGWLFVLPYHLNPVVRDQVVGILGAMPNVMLREPLPYLEMLGMLSVADVLVTDSGGLQEEAPSFSLPTLVTREVTERPEAVEAGFATVVGTSEDRIRKEIVALMNDGSGRDKLRSVPNPFGDGHAGKRCAEAIARFLASRRTG